MYPPQRSACTFLECTRQKKKAGLTQFWVKYGQTQPLGSIFNPMFEFIHI